MNEKYKVLHTKAKADRCESRKKKVKELTSSGMSRASAIKKAKSMIK